MPLYMRKPSVVDAKQWRDLDKPPRGVRWTGAQHVVTTMQGRDVPVSIYEWIVAEADGLHFYPIADSEFARIYQPV